MILSLLAAEILDLPLNQYFQNSLRGNMKESGIIFEVLDPYCLIKVSNLIPNTVNDSRHLY